jgi:YHS domain-containing protein
MTTNQTVHDPICHMDIEIMDAAGRSDYANMTYYFCSPGCKVDFDADPDAALEAEANYDHSQPMEHGMMADAAPISAGGPPPARKPWWKIWG